jgi:monoamine oxidase
MTRTEADVCVVGAGYAGLAAARRLRREGKVVAVLEARDRVGGRVWTQHLADGTPYDVGGTWIGPGQDEMYALASELDVKTYSTFTDGEVVLDIGGKVRRYKGRIPKLGPISVLGIGLALARLDRMGLGLDREAPWSSPHAADWDRRTIGEWIAKRRNVPGKQARQLVELAVDGMLTADSAEVSMLGAVAFYGSHGGLTQLISVKGGAQQDMLEGGCQSIALRMAAELGDAVHVDAPVRTIRQRDGGCSVEADGVTVDAGHVIVTLPAQALNRIEIDPLPQAERVLFQQRRPTGAVIKAVAIYDEPFWRADGLTGETNAPGTTFTLTLDSSPIEGRPGILSAYCMSTQAVHLGRRPEAEQREALLHDLARRFGLRAKAPSFVHLQNWGEDVWQQGGMITHYAPTVLSHFGHLLRAPEGRIHWAGSDVATHFIGAIEGAVRSGHRAADEVLSAG